MLKKSFYITFFLFMFFMLHVYAVEQDYPYTGGETYRFNLRGGNSSTWNTGETDFDTYPFPLTAAVGQPLVKDLDGDGEKEIIVLDQYVLRAFHTNLLDNLASYSLGSATLYAAPAIYDLDDDGADEVIILRSGTSNNVNILGFNGSAFSLEQQFNLTNSVFNYALGVVFSCSPDRNCVAFGFSPAGTFDVRVAGFNYTQSSSYTNLVSLSASQYEECLPVVPALVAADLQNNGSYQFVMSTMRLSANAADDEDVLIRTINYDGLNAPTLSREIVADASTKFITSTTECSNENVSQTFTAPLVADVQGTDGLLEVVVGRNTAVDEFKMYVVNPLDGSAIANFPQSFNADGTILSNVFLGTFFPKTLRDKDFCVLGYRQDADELDLLCASLYNTGCLFNTSYGKGREFVYDFDGSRAYAITPSSPIDQVFTPLVHSMNSVVEVQSSGGQSADIDEVLTPYGVFSLNDNTFSSLTCGLLTKNSLTKEFDAPVAEAAYILNDFQGNGRQDMIGLMRNYLYYIDDDFVNEGASILNVSFNPCSLQYIVKTNTTIQVSVKAFDDENDLVSSKVILYADTPFEVETAWSPNVSQSVFMPHTLTANMTGTYIIRVLVRDKPNADINYMFMDYPVTIGDNGFAFGSSNCWDSPDTGALDPSIDSDGDGIADYLVTGAGKGTNTANNTIKNSLDTIGAGSGIGTGVLFLIVMAIVAFSMWSDKGHKNPAATFGIITVVLTIMLFVGVYTGVLPVSMVILLFIVLIFALSITFRRWWLAPPGGG